jgi:hypothetical protein
MTETEIAAGVAIATQALHFAIFNNGIVTAGECRKAIVVLFGSEVDAALDKEFIRTGWVHP